MSGELLGDNIIFELISVSALNLALDAFELVDNALLGGCIDHLGANLQFSKVIQQNLVSVVFYVPREINVNGGALISKQYTRFCFFRTLEYSLDHKRNRIFVFVVPWCWYEKS